MASGKSGLEVSWVPGHRVRPCRHVLRRFLGAGSCWGGWVKSGRGKPGCPPGQDSWIAVPAPLKASPSPPPQGPSSARLLCEVRGHPTPSCSRNEDRPVMSEEQDKSHTWGGGGVSDHPVARPPWCQLGTWFLHVQGWEGVPAAGAGSGRRRHRHDPSAPHSLHNYWVPLVLGPGNPTRPCLSGVPAPCQAQPVRDSGTFRGQPLWAREPGFYFILGAWERELKDFRKLRRTVSADPQQLPNGGPRQGPPSSKTDGN